MFLCFNLLNLYASSVAASQGISIRNNFKYNKKRWKELCLQNKDLTFVIMLITNIPID